MKFTTTQQGWFTTSDSGDTVPQRRRGALEQEELTRLVQIWETIANNIGRIADALDPPPPDKVGSDYVAKKLDCTTTWVADMVRRGEIPAHCVVPGTGNGKPWKFFRSQIDSWIASR